MLEPCEGKLSRTVLRGESGSNTADLLDQLIENKQKFIGQIMTSKSPVRSCEDVDEAALSYAEVKALATGNPYIKEKMDLDIQVSKLKLLKANHTSQIYRLEDNIAKNYPKKISAAKEMIAAYEIDLAHYKEVKPADKESFAMKLGDRIYTDKKEAGTALISFCRQVKTPNVATPIGEYLGFKMNVTFDSFYQKFTVNLKGALSHNVEIGTDVFGNLTRIGNALDAMEKELQKEKEALNNTQKQLENAKEEVKKPFAQELELNEKLDRLSELNALLNMDEKGAEDCLEEIEMRSFEIIAAELAERGITLPAEQDMITRRVIHTSADFDYAETMTYSENAVEIAKNLIKNGADIVTDTNMALAGINKKVLASFGGEAHCYMADAEVAAMAKERRTTRAAISMELAAKREKPVIFAVGNAPTALIQIYEMMQESNWRPAFVIGVPVGFVNVEAAKELILQTEVPYIINRGRKGGSNVAAAICNALLYELRKER